MSRERNDVGLPRHQIEARLFEGQWKVKPARDLIVSCVRQVFRGRPWDVLEEVVFRQPDEEGLYLIVCIKILSEISDTETLAGLVHEALLARLVPEFDSLLEVEQDQTV
jgi:hypothetical protein